eukprot:CAMPEP_0167757482 /NCGR_PEP_ID=MMETSP0110_2-20121227/9951_1 /TAXON_ID=629695 /ORGANISM="Gymnochlora sp., Strain CCMP2014" /LENGTH=200 /DNA_ID=CAMNT_0007643679 /DNA_START=82 /DNA_END=684 /DNA_ORIENTATION=-
MRSFRVGTVGSSRSAQMHKRFAVDCEKRLGAAEEWGARDPFAAEIEFGFGTKVRNADTMHRMKPPKNELFGLANMRYEAEKELLAEDDIQLYENQIPGMGVEWEEERDVIKAYFTVKDEKMVEELKDRVRMAHITPGLENQPNFKWRTFAEPGEIECELIIWTKGTEGPILNDFIFAGSVNEMDLSEVVLEDKTDDIFHF